MDGTMTVTVPEALKARIEALSSEEGVSDAEWVLDALERQVVVRRFDSLRGKVLAELDARGERYSDEDVFRLVS